MANEILLFTCIVYLYIYICKLYYDKILRSFIFVFSFYGYFFNIIIVFLELKHSLYAYFMQKFYTLSKIKKCVRDVLT